MRCFALVLTASACMFVFGVVLLMMDSLPPPEVSYVQAGSLGSFRLAGILVATVLVGPVLEAVGAKSVLAAGLAMAALVSGLGRGGLMYGKRPTLPEILKWLKYAKSWQHLLLWWKGPLIRHHVFDAVST